MLNLRKADEVEIWDVYKKVVITSIKATGWLSEFLIRQKKGLTGNITAAGYPFDTCMWAGEEMGKLDSDIWFAWWPYEQTAYYLDGAYRLGLLLNDKELISKVNENMEYIKKHCDKKSGRIGTRLSQKWWRWPYASVNRLFMIDYEVTNDFKTVEFLRKHYLTFTAKDFADDLELANVEQLCWIYSLTGDEKLLSLAEDAYKEFKSDVKYRNRENGPGNYSDIVFGNDDVPNHHGVVYLELVKIPALLYQVTGKLDYLEDSINGLKKMEKHHMLVSGLPSTTEHFNGISEVAGTETCNTATFPYTYGYLLRITGDAVYGDKIEKAVFNGGMGSITKDFKNHQYFSSPNQVISTLNSNRFGHNVARMAYLPGHDVECCTGNVNRFMPYYIEQMWLKSKDHGLVAALYGPSEVSTTVGSHEKMIKVEQKTCYPFEDEIEFVFTMDYEVEFSFYLRIPQWCESPSISINGKLLEMNIEKGTFYCLHRTFQNKDSIVLKLPMICKYSEWSSNGIAVVMGPLVFSCAVESKDVVIDNYVKSNNEFRAINRIPRSKWNYGIKEGAISESIQKIIKETDSYPWDIDNTPLKLRIPVVEIKNWDLFIGEDAKGNLIEGTAEFPKKIVVKDNTTIDLVPYGCTLLRVSLFPKVSNKDI